ncbi:tRNA 4-thiouridine(8) synthase ThiI [Streptomyces armeniacus]|uniref:Probable tRNA sulfurtransferase n=1 Tax=Streptomyces armeniacus TaxID=83291 RepID=A0A345XIY7_9ACTN|nr:tRNA uracil 4-sulfurtransferase ThiI [Streptomyces armeniacus]AXK31603.1 tRNA 4-thiouridine(8) synthase ThiI [Streptomyces armeniacus]
MPGEPCVLLKYGELALKGRNKWLFERRLRDNVRRAMAGAGRPVRLRGRRGVLVVCPEPALPDAPDAPAPADVPDAADAPCLPDEIVARAQRVMGVSVVQPALRVPKTPEAAAAAAVHLARTLGGPAASAPPSFAVRARRRDKTFPLTSDRLAAYVGESVRTELGWPVDLGGPRVAITVEVDRHEVFVATERLPGQGGLPVGASGRALVLLSGGFDSPVAAYRAMRRGLHCEFVHFTGAPFTGPSSTYKAYALARELGRFQGGARLHTVPMGEAQRALRTAGAGELQIVAQRRLMVRTADRLAERLRAQALVTGDSLGQVSSQTLANLTAVADAARLPLLRPLLGWDKAEIMAEAARIGTADISRLHDEDCCSLLVPPRVTTRAAPAALARLERRTDPDATVDRLLARTRVLLPEDTRSGATAGADATESDATAAGSPSVA